MQKKEILPFLTGLSQQIKHVNEIMTVKRATFLCFLVNPQKSLITWINFSKDPSFVRWLLFGCRIDTTLINMHETSNTGRIQCEVLTTLPILSSWIKKFLGQQSKIWDDNSVEKLFKQPWENLQHHWSNNLRKNINELCGSQYPVAQCSLFKFFLKLLDQWCWRFSEGYLNNFSTELSSQIFDCCPRNFLIQEKQNGNVVSTSHWIRPVSKVSAEGHSHWHQGAWPRWRLFTCQGHYLLFNPMLRKSQPVISTTAANHYNRSIQFNVSNFFPDEDYIEVMERFCNFIHNGYR